MNKDEDEDSTSSNVPSSQNSDQLQRIDISNQITEALINELTDKNWKVRFGLCDGFVVLINLF